MKSSVLNYTIVLQKEPEGGFSVMVPALPGCVTYGKNLEEAKKMAIEAIELYVESLQAHNEDVPTENDLLYTQVTVTSQFSNA